MTPQQRIDPFTVSTSSRPTEEKIERMPQFKLGMNAEQCRHYDAYLKLVVSSHKILTGDDWDNIRWAICDTVIYDDIDGLVAVADKHCLIALSDKIGTIC